MKIDFNASRITHPEPSSALPRPGPAAGNKPGSGFISTGSLNPQLETLTLLRHNKIQKTVELLKSPVFPPEQTMRALTNLLTSHLTTD